MKQTALFLMIISIFSRIFGLLRDIVLSYYYGASNISDAYLISQTIPIVIFSFIGVGISTGYIPMYTRIKNNRGSTDADRFTSNLLNIILIFSVTIIAFTLLFADRIVLLFASGFKGETLTIASMFTRISIIGILFTSIANIFISYLQIYDKYIISAVSVIPMNVIIILSIVMSKKIDIIFIVIGSVLAILIQILLLAPFVFKKGFKYMFSVNIKDKELRSLLVLSMPVIIGVAINDINVLVDRTIASSITQGGISALNYANQINRFIHGVFVLSISTVFYPTMSKLAVKDDFLQLKNILIKSLLGIFVLVIPSTVGVLFFSKEIIELLFKRGEFDLTAISLTSTALFFYAFGMIGSGMREILSRPFYAMQDTKTPVLNAMLGMVINIVLNIILSKYLGIGGLALATSIAATFTSVLLLYSLIKKIGHLELKPMVIKVIKIVLASLMMGCVAKVSFDYFNTSISSNLSLFIAILFGSVSYFTILILMKIEEVDYFVHDVRLKLIKWLK